MGFSTMPTTKGRTSVDACHELPCSTATAFQNTALEKGSVCIVEESQRDLIGTEQG